MVPIGLAYAPSVGNPIGTYVLGLRGGANWSVTYVCCVIFFKTIYILYKSQNQTNGINIIMCL